MLINFWQLSLTAPSTPLQELFKKYPEDVQRLPVALQWIEAKNLAIVLRAGALPAPVKIIEERTVGPSLGFDSINQSFRAGLIGTVLVILFILFYYRISGIMSIIALIINIVGVLAAMAAINATLTLPGIAGIILQVGMGVDASVLILERIREELRLGKTVRSCN